MEMTDGDDRWLVSLHRPTSSSIICHRSSVTCHPSSVIYHPSSFLISSHKWPGSRSRARRWGRPAKQSRVPEGLWVKCPSCAEILYNKDLAADLNVCPKCGAPLPDGRDRAASRCCSTTSGRSTTAGLRRPIR